MERCALRPNPSRLALDMRAARSRLLRTPASTRLRPLISILVSRLIPEAHRLTPLCRPMVLLVVGPSKLLSTAQTM
jgi:hypothetical protein